MAAKKKGRQKPTQSVILPYRKTNGKEAVSLYNSTDRTLYDWQDKLLCQIMAVNKDHLWVHSRFGYAVPRRNGKSELLTARELYGLEHGEQILHTAHKVNTAHMSWERLIHLVEKANLPITSRYRARGAEHIYIEDGGRIEFRTRTTSGGLGEGYDLLVIDEAQEYTDDQESTLKYTISSSPNPQTIMCGTPPTPNSSGTRFTKYRNETLQGNVSNAGWAEWSVEDETDPHDKKAWYETNPSINGLISERNIQDEISDDVTDFNVQRLGLWLKYNQKSAITAATWSGLAINKRPKPVGKLYVGIKYGKSGVNSAMSIAVKTADDKIFVETIDCRSLREGNGWIIDFLSKADWANVTVDGANGAKILEADMKHNQMKRPVSPTVGEIIVANSIFDQSVYAGSIEHSGQPSLTQVITNCEKRPIGSNGGFGFKSIYPEHEIALMDSVILAHWACMENKEVKKQTVRY